MKKNNVLSAAGTSCGLARFAGKIGLVGTALVLAQTARADIPTESASDSAVFTTSGLVTDKTTFNIVNNGAADGSGETFGVIDFTVPAGTTFKQAQTLTLTLTELNPISTGGGQLDFFLSGNTDSIDAPDTTVKYKMAYARGINGQLDPRFSIGSKTFTPGATGDANKFKFNLTDGAQSFLTDQINSGGPIRIIIGANSAVNATFAGFNNGVSISRPKLTVADAPSPSSLLVSLLGVPGIGLLIRRRKSAK